jgi:hypothetical protein
MLCMIQEMKSFLRTAYGDSNTAAGLCVDIKMQGLFQGNGATSASWVVVSITILCAYKRKGHRMKIVCPVLKLNSHIAAVLYVDDTDVIHLDLGKEETVEEAHAQLQESVLSWGNLLMATGGSLKPSKCSYHLISFDFNEKGRWKYANNHKRMDLGILIPQPDDTLAGIEHLSVDQAHKTLGSITCPTGSRGGAIQQMQDKAQAWLDKAIDAKLSRRGFWFLMDRQFWLQVGFGLCNNTACFQELSEALQRIYWKLVPLRGLWLLITWEI